MTGTTFERLTRRGTSFYLLSKESRFWQKIEGHMTFYLERKNPDSKSEGENQEMECHTTFHLEGNIQIKQALQIQRATY
jgi:hypothetical protein